MGGVTIPGGNYDISNYKASGSPSFYLGNSFTFEIDGIILEVLVNGYGCGTTTPIFNCVGFQVYIYKTECAAIGISAGKHLEGPVLVPDYTTYQVLSDTGTLFQIKPPWLQHFLGVVSFVPIPLPSI